MKSPFDYYCSPDVITLTDAAFRAHVTVLAWCHEFCTDYLPARGVVRFAREKGVPEELVNAGLWARDETGEGFRIADAVLMTS